MTTYPNSPKLLKGGLVLIDPESARVLQVIALQYNPETLSRSLAVQAPGDSGQRSDALRLTGPPVETFKLEAELDATDQLEFPEQHPAAAEVGVQPMLSTLELLAYPATAELQANARLAGAGALTILPMETALTLFVWSRQRVMPVRVTDVSVTEEDFDPRLNPIRAKVSIGLRVLSVDDLGFDHRGGSLYMVYQRSKEQLARRFRQRGLSAFGIGGML